jgi:hypothetical protein
MRKLLGVSQLVEEQRIVSGRPIAIPPGTEIVTCFSSVFDRDWAIADYQWFFNELKRHGVSKVLWFPNRTDPELRDYFSSIGGAFPLKVDKNRFVVIDLKYVPALSASIIRSLVVDVAEIAQRLDKLERRVATAEQDRDQYKRLYLEMMDRCRRLELGRMSSKSELMPQDDEQLSLDVLTRCSTSASE